MKKERIYIVSEYIHSEQNSTGYYWSKLISRLSLEFDIITISPKRKKTFSSYLIPNVKHFSFNFFRHNGGRVLAKLGSQISQLFGFMKNVLVNVKKGEIIFSGTNPPLLLICLALIKRFKKFKWLVLVHDVFPENFVPAKVIRKNSLIYKMLFHIFNWAYSSADEVVVIGRDMKSLLSDKIGSDSNISFISNWINLDEINVLEKGDNKYINELGWQDKVVFTFFGNMGRLQGVENLLNAISIVEHPKASFLFLGNGPLVDLVQNKISTNPLLPIAYLGEVSLKDREQGVNAGDVALISLDEGMLGLGVPSKSYFSMAANKPLLVVAHSDSEISMLVKDEAIGWQCDTNSPKELAKLIDSICSSTEFLELKSSRTVLESCFSENICLAKFAKLLSSMSHKEYS